MSPDPRPLNACVHGRIVFVEDDGVVLATYGLALVVRARNIRLTELPASTRVIILSGYGASITVAAMHACVSKHIEVLIASPRYGIMAMFVPSPTINASRAGLSIRRKQWIAVCDPVKTVGIARAIVAAKVTAEGHTRTGRAFLAGLRKARTTDDVRHVEARAAQIWWRQWEGFGVSFKGAAVPAEWRVWTGRAIANPTALASLTLINTGVLPDYHWHYLARVWRAPMLGEIFMASTTRLGFNLLLKHGNPRGLPKAFIDGMFDHFDSGTKRAVLWLYRATNNPGEMAGRFGEVFRSWDCPTLVIWGRADPYLRRTPARLFSQSTDGCSRKQRPLALC